ncbi:Lysophospholipase L1 [Streptosporangium subroseum]|uniref:Lysophospholipase L1 n=1 Tax=Streptosporangium subroseum TaxID=106412 RepID=A0A239CHT9_9ACTN|nr:GDSL-type esterase/lipase family protein [Streptosporangium subroseum]SNS19700.1 Lysophospholipase L1 [Streptosporangium subroseum]
MRRRGVFRLSAVALAAVLTAGMTGVTTGPADAAAIGWTGTWAVSPQAGSTVFNQQTVRQIVHTSIGGTSARVQLSNAFGRQPVTIDNVHVARRTSDSGVDLGTDRVATFGGQRSVTIPAGSMAISDAIDLVVPAQSDLAVSIYLPQATGPATYHQTSSQTNYVTSGNVSANATLPGAQQVGSYYFLANLDVQNASAPGAVATLGASITDGVGSSSNTNRRWPNRLASRLVDSGRAVGVLNQGISGNKLLADGAGQSAPNRFERDVLAQPGVKWVIFSDDPINDLGVASPPAASQLIDAAKQLISRAHQRNITFICSTLTPFRGAGGWSQAAENQRVAYNTFVRGAGSGCDAVLDQDAATRDPANPTMFLPAYDTGDHLHPNEAGLQAIANAVNLSWFGAPGTPVSSVVSLRSKANGRYVTAANGAPLIANGTSVGPGQQFERVDLGNGNVALKAKINSMYVSAAGAGAQSLIADRATAGSWETFQLIGNPDGSTSIRAQVNGKYVCAEGGGAQPLIANRDAIGPWEQFEIVAG